VTEKLSLDITALKQFKLKVTLESICSSFRLPLLWNIIIGGLR